MIVWDTFSRCFVRLFPVCCLAGCCIAGGCASGTLRVRVYPREANVGTYQELPPWAEEAGDLLGLELRPVHLAYGAVTVDLADVTGGSGVAIGRAVVRHGCYRGVRSTEDATVLAHELGHALGLNHHDDKGNLMHPNGSGTHLEPWQLEVIHANAERLWLCR